MPDWNPSLDLGIPWIDAQHRELFHRVARFESAVREGEPGYRLEELFAFLAEYALEHFAAEEKFMREVGYPRLAEHVEAHREFSRQFSLLVPRWSTEGETPELLAALQGFLDTWLTAHVGTTDQLIGEFVRNPTAGVPAAGT